MKEDDPTILEKRGPFKVLSRKVIHNRFSMQLNGDKVIILMAQKENNSG